MAGMVCLGCDKDRFGARLRAAEEVGVSLERQQIARYLAEQLEDLYQREQYYVAAGLQWAIDRLLARRESLNRFEPAASESLDEFLRRESDGQ